MGRLKSSVDSVVRKGVHVRDHLIKDAWELYVEEGGTMALGEFSRLFLAFTYGMTKAGVGAVVDTVKELVP